MAMTGKTSHKRFEEAERRLWSIVERRVGSGEAVLRPYFAYRRDRDNSCVCLLQLVAGYPKRHETGYHAPTAERLGVSLDDVSALEAGFEGWERHEVYRDFDQRFLDLGRRIRAAYCEFGGETFSGDEE